MHRMTSMSKGSNIPLSEVAVTVHVQWQPSPASPDVDVSALLLTDAGKVSSDADLIFYNQPSHTSGAVSHAGKSADSPARDTLSVNTQALPGTVDKVVIAASADGGTFGEIPALRMVVTTPTGVELASFDIGDASTETAFVFGELYRRNDDWKLRAIGQGYDTGLAGLATDFGITVDDDPAASTAPAAQAVATATSQTPAAPTPAAQPVSLKKQRLISMEKRVEASAPALLSLTKKAAVSLEKRGLGDHTAKVALCLDISGSMNGQYRSGKIQALAERVLALGLRFDDDGAIDVFLFGGKGHHEGEMNLGNHSGYVDAAVRRAGMQPATNYGAAMSLVREHYFGSSARRRTPSPQQLPVYCMFLTDGATADEARAREQVLSSSYEPLFWQFMAIGRSSRSVDAPANGSTGLFGRRSAWGGGAFRFLEELDDMGGRLVDNADFFAVQDPTNISDEQLYDLLMTEYPAWLRQAHGNGLLR